VCILFHIAICSLDLGIEYVGLGLGLGLATAGLDYKSKTTSFRSDVFIRLLSISSTAKMSNELIKLF